LFIFKSIIIHEKREHALFSEVASIVHLPATFAVTELIECRPHRAPQMTTLIPLRPTQINM